MRKFVPEGAKLIPQEAKRVFQGVISDVYQWPQELFDGTVATFEMIKRPDTVKIVAILEPEELEAAGFARSESDSTKVVITQQEQPRKEVFYDIPGGRVDDTDPSELEAAKRELREETGLEFRDWKLVKAVQPFNKIDWIIYTFVATGFIRRGPQELDGGEKIEVMAIDYADFLRLEHAPEARYVEAIASSVEELRALPELYRYY